MVLYGAPAAELQALAATQNRRQPGLSSALHGQEAREHVGGD